MSKLLEAKGICKYFGGLKAVQDVDMTINKGDIFGIIGPNGAGKTTFFNICSGVYTPTKGEILLDGEKISNLKSEQIAQKGLARTFQNIQLFKYMTVLENVKIGFHIHTKTNLADSILHTKAFKQDEEFVTQKGLEIIKKVGLSEYRIFIGHIPGVGKLALTGLGITLPVILIITAFSYLIGRGGAPLVSILLGEKNYEDAEKIQSTSLSLLLVLGVIITIVFSVFCKPILLLFGATENSLPYAMNYMSIYILGTIPVMISMGMTPFLNAQGYVTLGTIAVAIGAILNLILDPLLIFYFEMGISGAAVATVISQTFSALWVLYLLIFSKRIFIRVNRIAMKIEWKQTKKICSLGVSNFVFLANDSIVQILLNWMILYWSPDARTGDMYIGCMTIIYSMYQIFFMPLTGIAQGMQPIVGYCYGEKNYKRMKKAIHYGRICSMTSAMIVWAIYMLFPGEIALLFTTETTLITQYIQFIRLAFVFNFVLGMQMINQNMFIAMGNAKYSVIFGIMRKIIVLIPLLFIFTPILGVPGVFLAEPVANIITVIITYIVFEHYMRSLEKETI